MSGHRPAAHAHHSHAQTSCTRTPFTRAEQLHTPTIHTRRPAAHAHHSHAHHSHAHHSHAQTKQLLQNHAHASLTWFRPHQPACPTALAPSHDPRQECLQGVPRHCHSVGKISQLHPEGGLGTSVGPTCVTPSAQKMVPFPAAGSNSTRVPDVNERDHMPVATNSTPSPSGAPRGARVLWQPLQPALGRRTRGHVWPRWD